MCTASNYHLLLHVLALPLLCTSYKQNSDPTFMSVITSGDVTVFNLQTWNALAETKLIGESQRLAIAMGQGKVTSAK
jgi:hypothetical protein